MTFNKAPRKNRLIWNKIKRLAVRIIYYSISSVLSLMYNRLRVCLGFAPLWTLSKLFGEIHVTRNNPERGVVWGCGSDWYKGRTDYKVDRNSWFWRIKRLRGTDSCIQGRCWIVLSIKEPVNMYYNGFYTKYISIRKLRIIVILEKITYCGRILILSIINFREK